MTRDTVIIEIDHDVELEISGIYDEGEPEILYPVDDAYPGSGESFEIMEVSIRKGNALDLLHFCSEELYFANGYATKKPNSTFVNIFEILQQRCLDRINGSK
jgi:hypothetical protein